MRRALSVLLAAMIAAMGFAIVGCESAVGGEKVDLYVISAPIYTVVGQPAHLPAARAERAGVDVSEHISVAVVSGGEVHARYAGNKVNDFTPTAAGEYTVSYSVSMDDGSFSDTVNVTLTVGENKEYRPSAPFISVSAAEVVYGDFEQVKTREARAVDGEGNDVSSAVKVKILNDMNIAVFEGDGSGECTVSGLSVGTYTVEYSLEVNGIAAPRKSYILTVVATSGIKPALRTPKNTVNAYAGDTVTISPATATDLIDGDISGEIEVRVETERGEIVLERTSVNEPVAFTCVGQGTYRVIYSVKNSRNEFADESGYTINVGTYDTAASGIALDGVIDERHYFDMPEYRSGLGGNVTYRFYADDSDLYIGAEVADRNLVVGVGDDAEAKLNQSDGLEFMFDPDDGSKPTIQNSRCFRVRIGIDGTVKTYIPTPDTDQWQAGSMDFQGMYAVSVKGTVTAVGTATVPDDTGYSVELKLPWRYFGYEGKPSLDPSYGKGFIRLALGHRDLKSTTERIKFAQLGDQQNGGENNCFYNGTNFNGRPKCASEGLNPSLYSRLYIGGDKKGVDPTSYEREPVLDGFMESTFWGDAMDIPFGETHLNSAVTAKIKPTDEGVFVGVYIEDRQIVAEARGFLGNFGMNCNDVIDLRIVPESEMKLTGFPAFNGVNITDSKVLFFDPVGAAYMQTLHPVGINRTHVQMPFLYATMVDGTVGYGRSDDKWMSTHIFIADENVDDIDNGWGVETFVPWSTLNCSAPGDGETVKLSVMLAIYDRNADPTGAAWKYGLRAKTSSARIVPNQPNTYFAIEKKIVRGE